MFWESHSESEGDNETIEERESEIDEIWDNNSDLEIDTKAVEERYSETKSDSLKDHQSRLKGDHENVEDMDKKTLEMCRDNGEHKVNFETSEKAKSKTYGIGTFKDVSYLRKGDKIRKKSQIEIETRIEVYSIFCSY